MRIDDPLSMGALRGPLSFGHTGFTGTSLWIDPVHDVYVVLLTNRVYSDASSSALQEAIQGVRRAVHDAVMLEVLKG